MKSTGLIPFIFCLLFIACDQTPDPDKKEKAADLEISMGWICGWCGGGDSLTITALETRYKYFNPCNEEGTLKETATNEDDWNRVIENLNLEKFQKLDLNTCNVCVDGCDSWISIKDGNSYHMIRYDYQDSTDIRKISDFVDALETLKDNFLGSTDK